MNTFSGNVLAFPRPNRSTRDAHNQRVAALAQEIARHFPLHSAASEVEAVAWLHDCPRGIFSDLAKFDELAKATPVVRGLLQAGGKDPGALIGEIVTVANSFDEMIEWLPVEHQTVAQMLEELDLMNDLGLWRPAVAAALRKVVKPQWDALIRAGSRLPVSAIGAVRNLAAISEDDISEDLICRTAGNDPVLTGDLLRVVNSWACPWLLKRVSSVREAICQLGTRTARTVLLTSAARKIYSSKAMVGLWQHSIEVAAHAQHLGTLAGCDPEVTFLGGLMHDVGRLAIEMLDEETLAKRRRLGESGVPVLWLDLVTCGYDHAELGGELLQRWNFPSSVSESVALHHSPERTASKLASLLYLAETRSSESEDQPSAIKLNYALQTTGLTREQLRESAPKDLFTSIIAA